MTDPRWKCQRQRFDCLHIPAGRPCPNYADKPGGICESCAADLKKQKHLTTRDTAEMLNAHRSRVIQLINEGTITATKHGRDWLIDPAEIEKRLSSNPGPGRPKGAPMKRLTITSTNPFRKTGCLKQKYLYDSDFRVYGKVRYAGAIRTAAVVNPEGRQWSKDGNKG